MTAQLVLIIDTDHPGIAMLQRFFAEKGFAVMIGTTAEAAESLLQVQRPDIILINRDLEAEWGFSFMERLRRDQSLAGVPVIVVSRTGSRALPYIEMAGDAQAAMRRPLHIEPFVALFRELTSQIH